MTISSGYATLDEFKYYQTARAQTMVTDANDDKVIEDMIEAASRYIDRRSGRTFYARTETHYHDVPKDGNRILMLDDDLLTIATLTNGDGAVLTSTLDYNLVPKNTTPHYAIKMKQSSVHYWTQDSNGNTEDVISIVGTWGFAATAPDDIKEACLMIAASLNKRRYGENLSSISTITAAGIVITPQDVPGLTWTVIMGYKRML